MSLKNIYIFIAIALDESIFLVVLHFPMKNIKSSNLEATPMGGETVTMFVYYCCVTSVAYRHDVKHENLKFWLFQNYVKSDLKSNNMIMSDDMCN